ncbi:GAF and ANTAR domain-containing protein [Mycobacterium sp.]|uniref:GAF and ANTAR domain-containing protein n=1 Tax=Mycobacterium sp. TaxID=1785 RepID=UPI003D14EE32
MTEFDAQAERQAPVEADLDPGRADADDEDLATGLHGLSAMVSAGRTLEAVLRNVAGFAVQAIPGAGDTGVGVTLIKPLGSTMGVQAWAATTAIVHDIDLMQYQVLKEGPCISCMQTRRAAVSGSLGADQRWPRFGDRVARLGVASALALPLLIDEQVVGSINVYARGQDVFGEHAVRLGTAFAEAAAVSVYNTQLLVAAQEKAEHLQRALVSRKVIDQAIGIIRGRTGGSAEDAFNRLKRISQSENTKLATVARNLVDETVRRAQDRYSRPSGEPPQDR